MKSSKINDQQLKGFPGLHHQVRSVIEYSNNSQLMSILLKKSSKEL